MSSSPPPHAGWAPAPPLSRWGREKVDPTTGAPRARPPPTPPFLARGHLQPRSPNPPTPPCAQARPRRELPRKVRKQVWGARPQSEEALARGLNVWVDSSMRDAAWWADELRRRCAAGGGLLLRAASRTSNRVCAKKTIFDRASGQLGALLSSPVLDVRLPTALQVLQVCKCFPLVHFFPLCQCAVREACILRLFPFFLDAHSPLTISEILPAAEPGAEPVGPS